MVFGIYAVALLATLLTVGRLSDHIGRRPVLLIGIAGQVLALVVFAEAHSVSALLAARIIQGLATGTAIGAIGAAMLDVDQTRVPWPTQPHRAWERQAERSSRPLPCSGSRRRPVWCTWSSPGC